MLEGGHRVQIEGKGANAHTDRSIHGNISDDLDILDILVVECPTDHTEMSILKTNHYDFSAG